MSNSLIFDNFKDFFNELNAQVYSVSELAKHADKAISFISDALHIGKIVVSINTPSSLFNISGTNKSSIYYLSPDGFDNTTHQKIYHTDENGHVIYTIHSNIGYVWSSEELEELDFIISNLHVFSERAKLKRLLNNAYTTDTLTGLPNIRGLIKYAKNLVDNKQFHEYTCMYINIRNFKYINRTFGSKQGDELLAQYAHIANNFLQDDEIFSRLGGDNFFAIIKNSSVDTFLSSINPITLLITKENKIVKHSLDAHIGIYPITPNDNIDTALEAAAITYNTARNHSNELHMWFKPEILSSVMYAKMVSSSFNSALQNDEFIVYYQPKISLKDNSICGCEALVRWVKDNEIIPPIQFIPVLESEGTICELDFYMLDKVCHNMREWLDEGIQPLPTSVNFSKHHLRNGNIHKNIIDILNKYNIAPSLIEIELTETSGYENLDALVSFFNNMKELGITTSIDDFGSGYSSLNLLKDINVDVIKLDKSFFNIDSSGEKERIVIRNIVNMINELGMSMLAEGVETKIQAEFLKSVNCHMAQGYLYDKPLPKDVFKERFISNTPYNI